MSRDPLIMKIESRGRHDQIHDSTDKIKSIRNLQDQNNILTNDSNDTHRSSKTLLEILEDNMERSKYQIDHIFKLAKTDEELVHLWNKEMNRLEENNDDFNTINNIN